MPLLSGDQRFWFANFTLGALKNMVSHRERRRRDRQSRENEKKAKVKASQPQPAIAKVVVQEPVISNPGDKAGDNKNNSVNTADGAVLSDRALPKRLPVIFQSLRRPQNFFALWLVVFACAQTIVGCYQWIATHDQYNAMLDQIDLMRSDQRAWITIDATLTGEIEVGDSIPLKIEINNVGKTPATVIKHAFAAIKTDPLTARHGVGKFEISPRSGLSGLILEPTFLEALKGAAEEVNRSNIISPNKPYYPPMGGEGSLYLTEDDIKKINAGQMFPVVVGYVRYMDTSRNEHETWACFIWNSNRRMFVPYSDYNSMD